MECPYHHRRWRGELQFLLNALRGKVLRPKHVRMFPAAVCICAERGRPPPSGPLDDLALLEMWVESHQDLGQAQPVLKKLLAAGREESLSRETREGLVGVVSLLKEVIGGGDAPGNPHRLEPELRAPPLQPVREKVTWELPLSAEYLGVFLGQGGRHIKPLCQDHSVSIHFGEKHGKSSLRRCHLSGSSVPVFLSYEAGNAGGVERVKEELKRRAERVTERRKQHESDRTAFYKLWRERARVRRQQRLQSGGGHIGPSVGVYRNAKEAATELFERKQHNKTRAGAGKPSFAALSDGHCLHCLAPYSPQQLMEGACTYHSGFLVQVKLGKDKGYYWTCCNKRTVAQHATHELHSKTGCGKGRHVWRPGKAAKGKAGRENSATGDFYLH